MKLFQCDSCGQILHFENTKCERCGCATGFDSLALKHVSIVPSGDGFTSFLNPEKRWMACRNHSKGCCNWLVPLPCASGFCTACQLNRYIPNLQDEDSWQSWREIELAKHRLVYSLLKLRLPVRSKREDPVSGMSFDFIDPDQVVPEDAETMTGHLQGKITIGLGEADPSEREKRRMNLQERYRTLLGHLRHEVGHYYWDVLIFSDPARLEEFRSVFGDEQESYEDALKKHYREGPPPAWNLSFITAYASSHPWEDWAETWAHYLHLTDTMETAYSLGISTSPAFENPDSRLSMQADLDPYLPLDFDPFLEKAVALTFAVNSINRSMGQPDLYPFILNDVVKGKLGFVHRLFMGPRNV